MPRGKSRRKADKEDEEDTTVNTVPPPAKRTRRGRKAAGDDTAAAAPTHTTDSGAQAQVGSQATASATSTSTSTTTSTATKGVWQWEADGGKWTDYSADHQVELSDALAASASGGQTFVVLTVPNATPPVKMRVSLARMVQANERTGWERAVRCLDTTTGQPGDWSWKDDAGSWKPYRAETSRLLEASYLQSLPSQKLSFGAFSYTVSLGQAMAQVNDSVGTSREVQRTCVGQSLAAASSTSASQSSTAATSSTTKSKKSTKAADKVAAKSTAKSKGKSAASGGGGGDTVRSVKFTGKAPVDNICSLLGKAHVYCEGSEVWDCMLNQTNIAQNNNKYYIIQLLESDSTNTYHVWQRWGRVGMNGQNNLVDCGADVDQAKSVFTKKFSDKTRNRWDDRDNFVKVPGKYDLVAIDYSVDDKNKTEVKDEVDGGDEVDGDDVEPPKKVESKLDTRLQSLIELICNVKAMEETVIEMKYDTKKAPLGKLTKDQVAAGYSALKEIEACINRGDTGRALVQACDDFYTKVPHSFGMRKPPLIDTLELVRMKLALLETLADIEVAMKILRAGSAGSTEHSIDRHYRQLDCGVTPLDRTSDAFRMVDKYVQQTHGKTHSGYSLTVLDVFEMSKAGEAEKFSDFGNRKLLWHGSRLSNWVGILSKGLRIAPPEAPVTGYMFGKGVYFADMSSKSANYCFATRSKNVGLLLCCDVSLGTTRDLLAADYGADKLPAGKHSVFAKGQVAPDPKDSVALPDGCVVPLGHTKDTGVKNPSGYTLNYNEYIVYKTNQVRMRYLVKVKFNFK